ncbi:hypothetical protein MBAV_000446 [Candidatus Magnetobacterium bavaricum]|uniref:Uncharacterized protein n=1 Tax=Candidatus Magnetobacterium bavaricum TaxID=29290 RepID=A0A0F3GZH1_9BACT|nr:hypothetical protein MBAV_000446 [Candidatus Magnetobacterium bavaricum]
MGTGRGCLHTAGRAVSCSTWPLETAGYRVVRQLPFRSSGGRWPTAGRGRF